MSLFLGELPCFVEFENRKYGVHTDFRDWIKFYNSAQKRDVVGMLKIYRELPPKIDTALTLAIDFGNKASLPYGGGGKRRVLDYEVDEQLIFAAFMGEYGIDLCMERLHWYKFCALLSGLGEERQIVKIMGIRSMEAGKISDEAKRREMRSLQRRYALADKRSVRERDMDLSSVLGSFY